jgi:hypothetical protein
VFPQPKIISTNLPLLRGEGEGNAKPEGTDFRRESKVDNKLHRASTLRQKQTTEIRSYFPISLFFRRGVLSSREVMWLCEVELLASGQTEKQNLGLSDSECLGMPVIHVG